MCRFDLPAFGEAPFGSARAARCRWCPREKGEGGGRMCQKCLLCQVDLLSELHFTECSQIFISLKAAQRYEQARIHICHHCPFYRVRRFLYKDGGGEFEGEHQGTFPSASYRQCFLKRALHAVGFQTKLHQRSFRAQV